MLDLNPVAHASTHMQTLELVSHSWHAAYPPGKALLDENKPVVRDFHAIILLPLSWAGTDAAFQINMLRFLSRRSE